MQYFLLLLFLVTNFSLTLTASPTVPTGWASVNANGQNGTSGGLGGDTVRVSTLTDMVFQFQRTEPLTILIEGMIDLSTQTGTGRYVFVHSHKSIIGAQPGSGIINGGFRIREPNRNIIFRNLNINNSPEDGIQLNGEIHHIWIDRCTFSGSIDGAVDITNGANYITISNSLFTGLNRTSLISSSDDDPFTDRYKVTFHHNWFRGTTQRHPRVRFGQVHVFNNFYSNIVMYGIGIGDSAQIISENNFFDGVATPSRFYDDPVNLGFFI
ncbi:MAG TPA: right-handed parallel beta-helix repeat-containing protein, partial [Bacteroidales bacterium]|nr:right-handed parallel beta-helix repeat-containing protein [Bacteroidales bacterium]